MRCLQDHIQLFYLLKYRKNWSREELNPDGLLATNIRQVKQQIITLFAESGVNWRTPKFESLDAWPQLIKMLGPPCFQTTDTWEATHLPNKHDSENTNHHNAERDVLQKVRMHSCSHDKEISLTINSEQHKLCSNIIKSSARTMKKISTTEL